MGFLYSMLEFANFGEKIWCRCSVQDIALLDVMDNVEELYNHDQNQKKLLQE